MSRCTGHCCTEFTLCVTMEHLRTLSRAYPGKVPGREYEQILDMVYPVGPDLYTCKHFDEKSGNCTIYEDRPLMCRDYPYGKKCERSGCTMSTQGQDNVDDKRDAHEDNKASCCAAECGAKQDV